VRLVPLDFYDLEAEELEGVELPREKVDGYRKAVP
jgi:hypothetical protein